MGRHAFLIIAHNEFGVLQRLIDALDDARVDFFVHIDAKVKELPSLKSNHSNIYCVGKRIDTRWGDYSQIETELSLFSEALKYREYAFYHLISGVHYPLMSTAAVLAYYDKYVGSNVVNGLCQSSAVQETLKLRHYNLFTRHFSKGSTLLGRLSQRAWRLCNAAQGIAGVWRNGEMEFYKAANWVSLSYDGLRYVVDHADKIRSLFHHTFCGDEYFVPTILMASHLKDTIVNDEMILMQVMGEASPKCLTLEDYDSVMSSGCVFARKFSTAFIDVVDMIEKSRA